MNIKFRHSVFLAIILFVNVTRVSALYAPLTNDYCGTVSNDIDFAGQMFSANTDLYGTYKFNSYRLTYRYELVRKLKFEFGLGFTAKIRDARIELSASGLEAEKTNGRNGWFSLDSAEIN